MVDSGVGLFAWAFEFDPGEWSLVNVEAPDIIYRFCSGVAAKDQKIGF